MTDKQINTCEFLNICQTDCNGTLEDTEMCHCYELYKQLKHKEQECERLSADLKSLGYTVVLQGNRDIDNAVDLFAKRIAKIENENSILKAEKEEIKKYLGISSKTIMERLIELQEFRDNYRDKLYQAEQTLAEIKGIANKVLLNTHDLELFKEADALFSSLLKIHKLISEVENENR